MHTVQRCSHLLRDKVITICPLLVWEPHRGAWVNIIFENGQYPHNSSYEATCLQPVKWTMESWWLTHDYCLQQSTLSLTIYHFGPEFIHNQHLVSVFFDLENAYDTTWKYGIMKNLNVFGLRGRLRNFISKCLHERYFKARVVSTFFLIPTLKRWVCLRVAPCQ